MNLGNVQLDWGHYPQSEAFFRQALSINESRFGKDSLEAADSASYVAQAIYFQGSREEEETRLLSNALASLERPVGDTDTRVAFTIAQMGDLAIERKNLDGGGGDYKRSAAIYRVSPGRKPPMGRHRAGERCFDRAGEEKLRSGGAWFSGCDPAP